jgi:hypothetical protein
VELSALAERVDEYGPVALLVTVTDDATPHVVSVRVGWRADQLVVGAGRRTATNVAINASVTLVWPAPDGGDYCLIVDGSATVDDADDGALQLAISPATAVLHRVAGADADKPSCIAVLEASPG